VSEGNGRRLGNVSFRIMIICESVYVPNPNGEKSGIQNFKFEIPAGSNSWNFKIIIKRD